MRNAIAAVAAFVPLISACASAPASRSWEIRRGLPYSRPAGVPLLADAWIPQGAGPHPAVLLVHGGGWKSGTRGDMDSIAKRLVRRGFVVVNASYRLAPAHLYPAPVEDLREALRWLRKNAADLKVDPKRVGAWGYSAGAHLAGHLAYESSGAAGLQAVVLGGTPVDLRLYPKSPMVLTFLGKSFEHDPGVFARASLNSFVDGKGPPTYLYHGAWDKLVKPEQPRLLDSALRAAGVPVEIDLVPWSGHVTLFLLRPAAVERAADFLERRLKGA